MPAYKAVVSAANLAQVLLFPVALPSAAKMDIQDLEQSLRNVSSGGYLLSCEELTAVQAGLTLLKAREKHQEMCFWGKILGKEADYYIAFGMGDSKLEYPSKCFYYAEEDFEFKPLPGLTEEVGEAITALQLTTPFTGIPTTPLEFPVEEGFENEALAIKATELERLSLMIQEIDFDTSVVPKGAHCLNEAQNVVSNSQFKGLDAVKAGNLTNYVHFRPPASVQSLKAYARNDLEFYSSFMDSLSDDLPKGCWATRKDPSCSLITLRSLTWPGYIAFHVPGTSKYGGVYFGSAAKNIDLAFLL